MPTFSKARVLVVDDTEANRYVVARHLRRAGYEVIEAGTGQQALALVEMEPDLVILDVKLPDMSGMDISRLLRANPVTRCLPILQVSATFTLSGDKVRGLDAGADAYLVSPIEAEELLAHVRMLLRLKSAQDALGKSNKRLESVLSTIVDVFFAVDFEWHFLEVNPAAERFFGRKAGDLIGKKIWEEFPAGAKTPLGQCCRQAMNERCTLHCEGESGILRDTWWEGHVYPREDRLDIYLRDITERKVSERRLEEAAERMRMHVEQLQGAQRELELARNQLRLQNEILEARVRERTARLQDTVNDLEMFSYSITHDMRAPLRAMHGFSRILLETKAGKLDLESIEYLKRIASAANRLDLLIRDVLSYGQVIRAQVNLAPVDTDLLLRNIIQEYPGFQGPELEIRIPDKLPVVMGNEALLTQCFSNLLNNAIKFVAAGVHPRVEVTFERTAGLVRFNVKDNGIGIRPEHQKHIFEMFQRAHTQYTGTGVGLAIVRKAVERMGGRIGVESQADRGSTFWFELREAPLVAVRTDLQKEPAANSANSVE